MLPDRLRVDPDPTWMNKPGGARLPQRSTHDKAPRQAARARSALI